MVDKKEIQNILSNGEIGKVAGLWKGVSMDEHYKDYEISEFSHHQQLEDGTLHTYDGVYNVSDFEILSDKTLDAIRSYRSKIDDNCNIWITTNIYGEEQVYVIYHNGTNGREYNALNSMRDASNKLEIVQSFTDWATLIDCYCDTCDDVYSWLFTFVAQTKE